MNVPTSPAPPGPPPPGSTRSNARVIAVVLAGLAVIGGLIALTSIGGDGDSESTTDRQLIPNLAGDVTTSSEPGGDTTPTSTDNQQINDDTDLLVGPETSDLARATVMLLQLDSEGIPICFSGSGSVVSSTGQILTNAHVV